MPNATILRGYSSTDSKFEPVYTDGSNRLLVSGGTSGLEVAAQGFGDAVSVTRPDNTTAYTANDVIGAAAGSTAALAFALGDAAGEYLITSTSLEVDLAAVPSGMMSFRLHLYSVTPPSALGDNVAWDLPAGDRASYLGYLDLGTPVDLGSTLFVQAEQVNKHITLASANLYGYLVTIGGHTPASETVAKINLHSIRL